jgi:hypothetical protein
MAKSTRIPTTAILIRFSINPDKLTEGFQIWTLEFPFRDAIEQYKTKVEYRIRDKVKGKKIGIPYRQLNNALMTVSPTLTHGFEYTGRGNPYRALAVGVPPDLAQLPDPENIRHVIREWAQLWTERPYIVNNIPEDEQRTLRAKLMTAINEIESDWAWRHAPANKLLKSFDPNEPLNYTALPSLLAAMLHCKESAIHGKQIQWRKVQDSDSRKLSIVGFVNQRPIWANYTINEFQMNKSGEGFFAYKLEFHLQTQAGRDAPWMFVSLHAQRYGHEALTHPNDRRRVSVLTAANQARWLDNFPVDSTLVKLRTREREDIPEWDDNLVELLERIGVSSLKSPIEIFASPQNYWRPHDAGPDYAKDEYYIVHAEGYGYGPDEQGHQLEAGFSMTDSAAVFDRIIEEHLTMLELDEALEPDNPAVSGRKTPRAMRDYRFMSQTKTLRRGEVEQAVKQALRGQAMLVVILWHNEDTRDAIRMALREALLLKPQEPFPSNVAVIDRFVSAPLFARLEGKKNFDKSRQQRIREWRDFLRAKVPEHSNCFAIVEMLRSSWQVKGAVRAACAQEGITSQMVHPIHLTRDSNGNLSYPRFRDDKHRASTVARETTIRHIGALYGDPQEVYQGAGIREENLEVIAFFLKQTQTNIKYPIAVKLALDGAVEVLLPNQKDWILYGNAAPKLGLIFAREWPNTIFSDGKRKIKDTKMSALYYEKVGLINFILPILKNLKNPTIALIEADTWRNYDAWPQLSNPNLPKNRNVLNFTPHDRVYERDDPQLENLLAVIRMRTGRETPQYLTDTQREFTQLAGFVDASTGDLMHFFSIGRQLVTTRGQRYSSTRHATMFDGIGAGVAYKYPQVVEFVPFFVREDYRSLDGLKQLCHVPHYLRVSPAWPQGNIVRPYPMHLAQDLVNDQLCILSMED